MPGAQAWVGTDGQQAELGEHTARCQSLGQLAHTRAHTYTPVFNGRHAKGCLPDKAVFNTHTESAASGRCTAVPVGWPSSSRRKGPVTGDGRDGAGAAAYMPSCGSSVAHGALQRPLQGHASYTHAWLGWCSWPLGSCHSSPWVPRHTRVGSGARSQVPHRVGRTGHSLQWHRAAHASGEKGTLGGRGLRTRNTQKLSAELCPEAP